MSGDANRPPKDRGELKAASLGGDYKPRLLDLFCGAGGAAKGYQRAGFYVVGVDNRPQPRYCGDDFFQADALETVRWILDGGETPGGPLDGFDAIHASPPCQHYSRATAWRGSRADHPDLIAPTRDLLEATGLPYVIENVEAARHELVDPVMICGDDVGLPIYRRRYFEANWPLAVFALANQHGQRLPFMHKGERAYADAMDCDWMSNREARQAIPPAYTELIGHQLMQHLRVAELSA